MTAFPGLSAMSLTVLRALQVAVAAAISLHPDQKGQPMGKVTRNDLIDHITTGNSISKAYATKLVDQVFGFITDRLLAGDKVALQGFGTFEARHRAARKGRNPRTGEVIDIAASSSIGFRPGTKWGK